MSNANQLPPAQSKPTAAPVQVVTPGLRRLLTVVLFLFGLLVVNSLYLVGVTAVESVAGRSVQNTAYLYMFLAHLALGILITVPVLAFGLLHLLRAWRRPNRYAVRAGLVLYLVIIALILSGFLLTRFEGLEINDQTIRALLYWVHVITPLVAVWLFVLHRLAGPGLQWRRGLAWSAGTAVAGLLAVGLHLWTLAPEPGWVRAHEPALA